MESKTLVLGNLFEMNQTYFKQFGSYSNFASYMNAMANVVYAKIEEKPELVKFSPKYIAKPKYVHNPVEFVDKQKMINYCKLQFHLVRLVHNYFYNRKTGCYVACLDPTQTFTDIQRSWCFGN